MHGWNDVVGAVLQHAYSQALGEGLRGSMLVAEHGVALPPSDQAGGVVMGPCKEKRHDNSCVEVEGDEIGLGEADLWADGMHNGENCGGDLVTAYNVYFTLVEELYKGVVSGGVSFVKVQQYVM